MIKPWATIQELLGFPKSKFSLKEGHYSEWGEGSEEDPTIRLYDSELQGDPFTNDWEIPMAKYHGSTFKCYEVLDSSMSQDRLIEVVNNLRSFLKGSN